MEKIARWVFHPSNKPLPHHPSNDRHVLHINFVYYDQAELTGGSPEYHRTPSTTLAHLSTGSGYLLGHGKHLSKKTKPLEYQCHITSENHPPLLLFFFPETMPRLNPVCSKFKILLCSLSNLFSSLSPISTPD